MKRTFEGESWSVLSPDFPSCMKPYESNHEHAVPLNFNHWCDIGLASSIEVADIMDLISSLMFSSNSLPRFICPSFSHVPIRKVVLCVLSGGGRSTSPFLSSCSSVPLCFSKSPQNLQLLDVMGDAHNRMAAVPRGEVPLATSLLLWPEVPSYFPFNCIPVNLFSQHRLIFNAYHTDWNDDIVLQSDASVKLDVSCSRDFHKYPVCTSPDDVFGVFMRKNTGSMGYFIIQENRMLHLYFDGEEKEYIGLQKVMTNNVTEVQFRSVKSSQKADVILSLSLVDIKVSKYSTLTPLQKHMPSSLDHTMRAVPSQGCQDTPCELKNDLCHMAALFHKCREQCPNGYESAVCSDSSLEVMGFNRDEEAAFVSTKSWNSESTDICNIVSMDELEEGEEIEEIEDVAATRQELVLISDLKKLSICALDCEMCCTESGTELTRISVLCPINGLVIDTLVKPLKPITNYNFEYSGINEDMLANVTVTRADVLDALSRVVDSSTIIVGHSLSCDFDALGITHTRVVDTAALYPHKQGWPFKRSLKELALQNLSKEIQVGECGHSPISDALIAFELATYFIMATEETRASFLPPPWSVAHDEDRHTIFHHIHSAVTSSANATQQHDVISFVHHSCKGYQLDMAEKFCSGDGLETDVNLAFLAFQEDPQLSTAEKTMFEMELTRHQGVSSAVEALTQDLHTNRHTNEIYLMNISCKFENDVASNLKKDTVSSLEELDAILSQIYDACPCKSMMLVVAQEDISQSKKLAAKKQRCRWHDSSKRAGNSSMNIRSDVSWTDGDEAELQDAIARASSGAMYMKYR